MLAGLGGCGQTTVIEPVPTRDHTENMLRHFGLTVKIEDQKDGAQRISLSGQRDLKGTQINVPSDPSSAAFPMVAALINPGSKITLTNILMNKRRIGLFRTLEEMGAKISYTNEHTEAGETVADIYVEGSNILRGVEVPPERVPSMIDEFPILAVAASCAEGKTNMTGLEELRVKESDRLLMMAQGLKDCGVKLDMGHSSLTIHGNGKAPSGNGKIKTALDHRIAMSFLVLGTATDNPVEIDDMRPISTSFPNFIALMNSLGANIYGTDDSGRQPANHLSSNTM